MEKNVYAACHTNEEILKSPERGGGGGWLTHKTNRLIQPFLNYFRTLSKILADDAALFIYSVGKNLGSSSV